MQDASVPGADAAGADAVLNESSTWQNESSAWHGDPNSIIASFGPGLVTSLGRVDNEAQLLGTRCAALACVLSAWSISQHLRRNASPVVRAQIVRILLLVPVYAIDAAMGLQQRPLQVPRHLLREAYEAYALLSFMRLVFACHKGAEAAGAEGCRAGPAAARVLRLVQIGVWQYVVLCGVVVTVVAFVAWLCGDYHEGNFQVQDAYLYCTVLQFVSQSWALASVVRLLHHTREELAPMRPVLKFLSIKLLIFFTWVQSVGIMVLENLSSLGRVSLWIETSHTRTITHWWDPFGVFNQNITVHGAENAWNDHDIRSYVGTGLGCFLLCWEMLLFAILHCWAYPGSEWDPRSPGCASCRLLVQGSGAPAACAAKAAEPLLGGSEAS